MDGDLLCSCTAGIHRADPFELIAGLQVFCLNDSGESRRNYVGIRTMERKKNAKKGIRCFSVLKNDNDNSVKIEYNESSNN